MVLIEKIHPDSPAKDAGLKPGDQLVEANGHVLHDALDVEYYIQGEPEVALTYIRDGQTNHTILINADKEPSGIEPELLKLRRCNNRCIFCFIDQQPKELRPSLHVKDEDIRYSFLYGNYITATNIPDWEWERVIEQKISPLYFSVHSTDENIRAKLLGINDPPRIMPLLRRLTEAGIQIHSQIVLVPGYNDGEVLRHTLSDLYSLGENSESCAIVPVGLTRYRENLPVLEPVTKIKALEAIDIIVHLRAEVNRPAFLQAADELFYLAELPIPETDYYGDFPQLDNGVGMARLFIDDAIRCAISSKKILDSNRELTVEIITGTRSARLFEKYIPANLGIEGVYAKIIPVENRFWGNMVTAANLLTGQDILNAIKDSTADTVFIPPNCINNNGLFLDDISIHDVDNTITGEIAVGVHYLSEMQELIIDYSSRI